MLLVIFTNGTKLQQARSQRTERPERRRAGERLAGTARSAGAVGAMQHAMPAGGTAAPGSAPEAGNGGRAKPGLVGNSEGLCSEVFLPILLCAAGRVQRGLPRS